MMYNRYSVLVQTTKAWAARGSTLSSFSRSGRKGNQHPQRWSITCVFNLSQPSFVVKSISDASEGSIFFPLGPASNRARGDHR